MLMYEWVVLDEVDYALQRHVFWLCVRIAFEKAEW